MNKFKFGIFDFDGNIINTMPTYTKVFSEILKSKFGINTEDSKDYYLDSTSIPINFQFKHILEKNKKSTNDVPQLVDEFYGIVDDIEFNLFVGAKELIGELFDCEYKLFITTGSKTTDTKIRLEKAKLKKYFYHIFGADEIPKGPKHIKKFAQSVNLSVEDFSKQAFYCGDGPRDMEIARMFGIYAIGIAQSVSKEKLLKSGADIAIDKIGEVINLEILK